MHCKPWFSGEVRRMDVTIMHYNLKDSFTKGSHAIAPDQRKIA